MLVLERRDAPRQDSRAIEHLEDRAPGLVRRGWEVTNLRDSASHAEVTACSVDTDETAEIRAQVVVGADGAHSTVRNLLRIPTRGRVYPDSYLMGDLADPGVRSDPPGRGAVIHLEAGGVVESFRLPGGRRRSARRLVTTRCVLIGDAVHEVSPIGGQGMTLSWLEAPDLAPLLEREARRMHGAAPRALHRDPAWRHLEGRCRRRARTAGALAFVNTALGRPLPELLPHRRSLLPRLLRAGFTLILRAVPSPQSARAPRRTGDGPTA